VLVPVRASPVPSVVRGSSLTKFFFWRRSGSGVTDPVWCGRRLLRKPSHAPRLSRESCRARLSRVVPDALGALGVQLAASINMTKNFFFCVINLCRFLRCFSYPYCSSLPRPAHAAHA